MGAGILSILAICAFSAVAFCIYSGRWTEQEISGIEGWSRAETLRFYALFSCLVLPVPILHLLAAQLFPLMTKDSLVPEILSISGTIWGLAVALLMGGYPQWMRPQKGKKRD